MAASTAVLKEIPRAPQRARGRRLDLSMFAGVAIALVAAAAGVAATGVKVGYFLQPTGALIVLGGTLGVIILTTPRTGLLHSARRVRELLWTPDVDRAALVEEIMGFVHSARATGLFALEPAAARATNPFLRESLLLMLDTQQRDKLKSALDRGLASPEHAEFVATLARKRRRRKGR